MRGLFLCSAILAGISICWAQASSSIPVIVGAGSSNPSPVVAPGQVLTIFVQPGAGYNPSESPAVSAFYSSASGLESMPVLGVSQSTGQCTGPTNAPCPNPLTVTIQIPFDVLTIPPVGSLSAIAVAPSYVGISVDGVDAPVVNIVPLQNHVHILTSCDTVIGGSPATFIPAGLPCPPVIVHPDGTQVSRIVPAAAGEELVAYATGLGQTNPPLTTGQPAAQSSPAVAAFSLDFNYRTNALATEPGVVGAPMSQPLFAGSTKGFVGLYQINFIVPPPPAGLQPCVNNVAMPASISGNNTVESNLTVSIGSDVSFDGAGICVEPKQVLDPPAAR
jgi:hypothetical protein